MNRIVVAVSITASVVLITQVGLLAVQLPGQMSSPRTDSRRDSAPRLVPFQGHLTRPSAADPRRYEAVPDGQYSALFTLYTAPVGGESRVWGPERHEKLVVFNGLVNALIGSVDGGLEKLKVDDLARPIYVGITIDADGKPETPDLELVPRQILLPAIYAHEAGHAVEAQWATIAKEAENTHRLSGHDWSEVQTIRHRQYHGIIDVSPTMPARIDVFTEDTSHLPKRVVIALRGDRFSPVHYSEMPNHGHVADVVQQPEPSLTMAAAAINFPGAPNRNTNQWALIVAVDNLASDPNYGLKISDIYRQIKMISLKPVKVEVKPTGPVGPTRLNSGKPYEWAEDLKVSLVGSSKREIDITSTILARRPGWSKLGDGTEKDFNCASTGLVDITSVFLECGPKDGLVTIVLSLRGSGGKIHYDIITD